MTDSIVRQFDRIQEHDEDGPRTPRSVTALLVVLGGACVVFAGLAMNTRRSSHEVKKLDPLGELVAQKGKEPSAADLKPGDVTFPGILSDRDKPTTALAAVRAGSNADTVRTADPPPPSDRLPVVPVAAAVPPATGTPPAPVAVSPLPAQNVLGATPLVTHPRDSLTRAAVEASEPTGEGQAAEGHDGAYQLQVSSFRSQAEANHFADQLRARGHRAHVNEARVQGRGTWYRVRVGPFPTQQQAVSYRSSFEQKEHVVPFVVTPAQK
jgi:cell division septation protein DedD